MFRTSLALALASAASIATAATADISTLSMDSILLVSVFMAEDVAFRLTRTLITLRDRLIQIHASLAA